MALAKDRRSIAERLAAAKVEQERLARLADPATCERHAEVLEEVGALMGVDAASMTPTKFRKAVLATVRALLLDEPQRDAPTSAKASDEQSDDGDAAAGDATDDEGYDEPFGTVGATTDRPAWAG